MKTPHEALRVDGYTVNPHSEYTGCCKKKTLAMCYSEPTECSKNPVMFSLHLVFKLIMSKQPVKVSVLPVDGVTRVLQQPSGSVKTTLTRVSKQHSGSVKATLVMVRSW